MSDQDLLMMDVTLARFWLVPGWLAVFFFFFFFRGGFWGRKEFAVWLGWGEEGGLVRREEKSRFLNWFCVETRVGASSDRIRLHWIVLVCDVLFFEVGGEAAAGVCRSPVREWIAG